jgi:hypothetical protein
LLGRSYPEISALSSSQHKSQGWGRRGERGYRPEFLEHMKGAPAKKDIFEGIDTTWNRLRGGAKIQNLVTRAIGTCAVTGEAGGVAAALIVKDRISDRRQIPVEKLQRLLREAGALIHPDLVKPHPKARQDTPAPA